MPRGYKTVFTEPPRARREGVVWNRINEQVTVEIGPSVVQGVSPATSDALTAVLSVDAVAQTGWAWYGGVVSAPVIMGGAKNGRVSTTQTTCH